METANSIPGDKCSGQRGVAEPRSDGHSIDRQDRNRERDENDESEGMSQPGASPRSPTASEPVTEPFLRLPTELGSEGRERPGQWHEQGGDGEQRAVDEGRDGAAVGAAHECRCEDVAAQRPHTTASSSVELSIR